jgi:hypothetical protein
LYYFFVTYTFICIHNIVFYIFTSSLVPYPDLYLITVFFFSWSVVMLRRFWIFLSRCPNIRYRTDSLKILKIKMKRTFCKGTYSMVGNVARAEKHSQKEEGMLNFCLGLTLLQ